MKAVQTILLAAAATVSILGASEHIPAAAGLEPEKTYAVIVGVLEWADKGIGGFGKENRKDQELYDTLVRIGMPTNNMILLLDDRATLGGICTALSNVLGRTTPDSTFIFYYAGHGGSGVFLNYDCASTGNFNVSEITVAAKKQFKGRNVLLMADCCFSGGLGTVAANLAAAGFKAASLTSADPSVPSSGNWTFTQTILDALNGNVLFDEDHDGFVTLGEAAAEVAAEMKFREYQPSGYTVAGLPDSWRLARTKGAPVSAEQAPGKFMLKQYVNAPREDGLCVGRVIGWETGRYLIGFYDYTEKTQAPFEPSQLGSIEFKTFETGKVVTVSWRNEPVAAKVVRQQNGFHWISYIGWPSDWDEYVNEDRILGDPTNHPPRKDFVLVEWKDKWYPATIIATNTDEKSYYIHYVGDDPKWDEWVTDARMKGIN